MTYRWGLQPWAAPRALVQTARDVALRPRAAARAARWVRSSPGGPPEGGVVAAPERPERQVAPQARAPRARAAATAVLQAAALQAVALQVALQRVAAAPQLAAAVVQPVPREPRPDRPARCRRNSSGLRAQPWRSRSRAGSRSKTSPTSCTKTSTSCT